MSTSTSAPGGLTRLGQTPGLVAYVRSLWARRQFAVATAAGEMRSQHMDTVLGSVWHLLNPVLLIAVYYLVFGLLLQISRGLENFLGYLAIGVFFYHWSQRSTLAAARTIISNEGLIRSLQFPRALLPFASVMRETLSFAPAVAVMLITVVVTERGQGTLQIDWAWLLLIPSIALQLVFNLGAALFIARISDKFRDTVNILPFLFRLAFYGSGVIYSVENRLGPDGIGRLDLLPWFLLDPFYVYLSIPREYLLAETSQPLIGWMWVAGGAWAVVALVVGLLVFRGGEREYGRG